MKTSKFLALASVAVALSLSGCGTTIHRSADGKIKCIEFAPALTVAGSVGVTKYGPDVHPIIVTPPWTQDAYIAQTERNFGLKPK